MNTQVEVLVNGKPIKQYSHQGKTYIEAKIGTEYSVKIRNSSYRRKLVVVTVDGLNVISGKPQEQNTVGEGYVVGAYDSLTVNGFRKDMSSVGAFKFCQAGKSYCNEQGLKGNNGVIGVRIYDEKIFYRPIMVGFCETSDVRPANHDYVVTCNSNASEPSVGSYSSSSVEYMSLDNSIAKANDHVYGVMRCASQSSPAPKFDAGTTWGKAVQDKVVSVDFESETIPSDEYVIFYDVRKNLENIGICFAKKKEAVFPKPFGAFATPPKGWNG